MSISSSLGTAVSRLGSPRGLARDPRVVVRVILALLLAANLAAALVLFQPWGTSAQELSRLREQVLTRQSEVDSLRGVVDKVEQAREDGDRFMRQYFMADRAASSTIIEELGEAAATAGIAQQAHSYQSEPIEGSDDLSMMTISGVYEGSYPNLVRFMNLMDSSPRFLILETLTAAPERTAGILNVNLRIHAFVIHGPESDNIDGEESASEVTEARLVE